MVANGGRLVTPYVGIDVEEAGDDLSAPDVLRRFEPPPSQPTGVDPAALAVVQQGLFQATHGSNGTATSVFGSFPVDIAGKTGTAEKVMTLPGWDTAAPVDQSWWCGYGPVEEPKIVVCSLIENGGHGGTAAAPAALRVFEEYFGAKAAYELPSVSD
jgi:penicillin-binding protein 2